MLKGNTVQEQIYNFLTQKGMTPAGAAGAMGNLRAESGLSAINLQNSFNKKMNISDAAYTQAVDNGTYTNFVRDSAGYGIAQWTFWSRKQKLFDFLKQKKLSIGNLEGQLQFFVKELKENYKPVWKVLISTDNVRLASNTVLLQYEKPANQGEQIQNVRYQYSLEYYNQFASGKDYIVGCIVDFIGNEHFSSSNALEGRPAKKGSARITAVAKGSKHPYHIVHTDSNSNVYGWVNENSIK